MKFVAFSRELQGTGASRRLRKAGKVPAIVYGVKEPKQIELDHNALYHALKKEAFHCSILDMELDGAVEKVVLRDLQMHPFRPLVLHVDFQRVDATTRIHKRVPLHFVNEAESPCVKTDKGSIQHIVTELDIECLAEQLPEFLTVDLSTITTGTSLHVNDLKLDSHIKVRTHGRVNPVICSALPPKVEEIVVPVATPAKDAKGKKKK